MKVHVRAIAAHDKPGILNREIVQVQQGDAQNVILASKARVGLLTGDCGHNLSHLQSICKQGQGQDGQLHEASSRHPETCLVRQRTQDGSFASVVQAKD